MLLREKDLYYCNDTYCFEIIIYVSNADLILKILKQWSWFTSPAFVIETVNPFLGKTFL